MHEMRQRIGARREGALPVLRVPYRGEIASRNGQARLGKVIVMADDLEKTLGEVQATNQQLQALLMQKQTLTVQSREVELALEEVEKANDDVYKSIGPIIMKSSKEQLKKELAEMKEQIGFHVKTIEKQEKRIKDSLTAAQTKLQQLVKPSQSGA